ncbi:MAG: diguanylate cyclase [Methylococcales bacterium]
MVNPYLVYSQKLLQIYKRSGKVFFSHCLHAAVFSAVIWHELQQSIFFLWLGGVLVGGLWQWLAGRHHLKQVQHFADVKRPASHILTAGIAGLSFGLTALLFPYFTLSVHFFGLLMLGAIAAGALPRLAALPSVYSAYVLGVIGPALVVQTRMHGDLGWQVVPFLLLMAISLLLSARHAHADLMETLLSRFGLENAADEDKLTRIANRRRFDHVLEQEWRRAARNRVPLSLILIDIDYFKKYNDRYGHQPGDQCLAQVARALARSAQRASDLVARYGGEEFVILLYHMTRDDAFQLGERMRTAVENLAIPHLDSPRGRVTISLGGASLFPPEQGDSGILVQTADQALYKAKERGRNRVEWQSPI